MVEVLISLLLHQNLLQIQNLFRYWIQDYLLLLRSNHLTHLYLLRHLLTLVVHCGLYCVVVNYL